MLWSVFYPLIYSKKVKDCQGVSGVNYICGKNPDKNGAISYSKPVDFSGYFSFGETPQILIARRGVYSAWLCSPAMGIKYLEMIYRNIDKL